MIDVEEGGLPAFCSSGLWNWWEQEQDLDVRQQRHKHFSFLSTCEMKPSWEPQTPRRDGCSVWPRRQRVKYSSSRSLVYFVIFSCTSSVWRDGNSKVSGVKANSSVWNGWVCCRSLCKRLQAQEKSHRAERETAEVDVQRWRMKLRVFWLQQSERFNSSVCEWMNEWMNEWRVFAQLGQRAKQHTDGRSLKGRAAVIWWCWCSGGV